MCKCTDAFLKLANPFIKNWQKQEQKLHNKALRAGESGFIPCSLPIWSEECPVFQPSCQERCEEGEKLLAHQPNLGKQAKALSMFCNQKPPYIQ